jgi:hypothetical protein
MFDQSGGWKPDTVHQIIFWPGKDVPESARVCVVDGSPEGYRPIAAAVATVALVTVVAAGIGIIAWMI